MNLTGLPKYLLIASVFTLLAMLPSCRSLSSSKNKLDHAEELMRQEKYDDAINLYKKHMESRLAVPNRPAWENPYFYHLLIGDIELRRSNVNAALENYKTAQANGIHLSLISDRMRYMASWYEEKGELEEAIALLKANRELDPLLFDAMLDRISKDLIQKQDQEK